MNQYKFTAKGRLALTVLIGAVCLVVVLGTAGLVWGRSQPLTPAVSASPNISESPGLNNITPESGAPGASPAPSPETSPVANALISPEPSPTPIVVSTPAQETFLPVTPMPGQDDKAQATVPAAQYLLLFNEGSAELDAEHERSLDEFIGSAASLDGLVICCEGRSYGEDETLGLERAKAAAAYLRGMGIPAEQILPVSSGDAPPGDADPAQYRRVRLYFIGSGGTK